MAPEKYETAYCQAPSLPKKPLNLHIMKNWDSQQNKFKRLIK